MPVVVGRAATRPWWSWYRSDHLSDGRFGTEWDAGGVEMGWGGMGQDGNGLSTGARAGRWWSWAGFCLAVLALHGYVGGASFGHGQSSGTDQYSMTDATAMTSASTSQNVTSYPCSSECFASSSAEASPSATPLLLIAVSSSADIPVPCFSRLLSSPCASNCRQAFPWCQRNLFFFIAATR